MAIAEIIKYEGDNCTFVWKHPCEDFNSLTQLIVHESQEAYFFMNGQMLDGFGAGRYTLETQNVPKLSKILNRSTNGETPFHAEVYFVNLTVQMGLKWGTDSKVRFLEPKMGLPVELGASGEMNLQVSNSRKLLTKLVGTTNGITWLAESAGLTKSLNNSFRPLISTAVKTHLASTIKKENIDILEIDEHLELLSEALRKNIVEGFEEYGLTIPQFYVNNVVLPENDPNFRRLRELHTVSFQTRLVQAEALVQTAQAEAEAAVTSAQRVAEIERQITETEVAKREAERKLIEAQTEAQALRMQGLTEAEIMQAKGYTQKDVLQADVQKAFAEGIGNMGGSSEGNGGMMKDILGLGLGMAAAGTMGGQVTEMLKGFGNIGMQPSTVSGTIACPNCGNLLPQNAKFCIECGAKLGVANNNEVVCPSCGKKTLKGRFCIECGESLQEDK